MMARSRRELAKAHMPQLAAERRLGDRNPELFEEPLRQIDQPPADDAMQGGNRPIFHDLPQGLALALAEDAGSARRFAGQETIRTFGVETDNPVAHDLHPDPADPRRIRPRAAIINLGQCQETPGLIGVTRSPRQHAQANRVKVRAKRNRSRHGKLSQKLFAMVNQINADLGIRLRSQTFRDLVLTSRRDLAIVPNSVIAKSKILNANFPSNVHGITIAVQLDSRTPPASGTNILELSVLNSRSILAMPRPTVRVTSIDASQTGYEITFFVEQLNSATAAQNELFDLIFRHVAVAGAQLAAPKNGPYPAREEYPVKTEKTLPESMLDLVAIFDTLMPNERASIAAKLKQISYEKGDTVVEPETVLQSLFIVGNGVLSVTKRGKSGETELLRFGPGDVFGEIGLLTGAPCGASVNALAPSTVYELTKRDLAPVLEARPQIAQELSRALAQQQNAGRALAAVERDETEEKGKLSTWFSERIHDLFDLRRAH